MLDPKLLKIIVCPKCTSRVELKDENIICIGCKYEYAVMNGIPIMASEDLSLDEKGNLSYFDSLYSSGELLIKYREDLVETYEYNIGERYFYKIIDKEINGRKYVLDAGCGGGSFGKRIIRNLECLFNFDISYQSLRYAQNRINSDKACFIQGNLNYLPFENASFDMIVCNWVLHHIKNLDGALKEISRVLKKDGLFLCCEPTKRYSWFEFWVDFLMIPDFFAKKLKNLYFNSLQKKFSKKNPVFEQLKSKGKKMDSQQQHFRRTIQEYVKIFHQNGMNISINSVCIETVPPRLLFNKNKYISKIFCGFSDLITKLFNLNDKGRFIIIQYKKR
jgi:ubiquinone/menaquinone biosynthesis C-methylase UbiE/uncharacterized protein YbaR (Trm112 family)